jgi:hypothetical protein
LHIAGQENAMTDIPSRSFGSEKCWYCKNDDELLILFNATYPLPEQNCWTVFQISFAIRMRVISVLRMQAFGMAEWRRLPKLGMTVDYRMRDVVLFIVDEYGDLKQLPRNASEEDIMAAQ